MDAEKLAKLPVWAKEHIRQLELMAEPNTQGIIKLRKKVEHLEKAMRRMSVQAEAMVAMFRCAAKGGNEVAAAVQRIVEDFLVTDAE